MHPLTQEQKFLEHLFDKLIEEQRKTNEELKEIKKMLKEKQAQSTVEASAEEPKRRRRTRGGLDES